MEDSFSQTQNLSIKRLFKFELGFYKVLVVISKYTKLYLSIPELIIMGFGFKTPTLFCTDHRTGELLIKEGLTKQAISESFILFANATATSNGLPIALCKTAHNSPYKDKSHLLFTPAECDYTWDSNLSQNKPQIIQKFIRNLSTSIYRSDYSLPSKVKTCQIRKKREDNLNRSVLLKKNIQRLKFIIANNDNCSRFPMSAPVIENKMMYLVYLIEKYFIKEYKIKILSLKCNWIEDTAGRVYFLNLKEYKIVSKYVKSAQGNLPSSNSLPVIALMKN